MSKKAYFLQLLQQGDYLELFNSLDNILKEEHNYHLIKKNILHSLVQDKDPSHLQRQAIEMLIQDAELKEQQAISPSEELNEQLKKANADLEDAKRLYVLRERVREELFEKTDKEIAQHYPEIIFYRLYTSEKLSSHELGDLHNFIEDKNIGWQHKIMVVASITISLLRKFDADRLNLLVDFVNKYEEEVWQRAFTGLVLALENVPIAAFEMYHPNLYRKIHFLQQNDYIQEAYKSLLIIVINNWHKMEIDHSTINKIFSIFGSTYNLNTFTEINKVANTIEIDEFSTTRLFKLLGELIADIPFFQENKIHHWFLGIDKHNSFVKEAIWNTQKNAGKDLFDLLELLPMGSIIKHTIIFNLNNIDYSFLDLMKAIIPQDKVLNPFFSFLIDLFLFEEFYPNAEKILRDNINLFNDSLADIFLVENKKEEIFSETYFVQGIISNNPKISISSYELVIKYKPDNIDAWNNLALTYHNEKNYTEAKRCYLQVIAFKPDKFEAWNNLGAIYTHENNYDEAKECYKGAIKAKGDYLNAWRNLALVSSMEQNIGETKQYIKQALTIDENQHDMWIALGLLYEGEGNYAEAKKCYYKVIDIKEDNHEAWNNLGNVYEKEGNYEEAKKCYQKVIDIKVDKHEAWYRLGWLNYLTQNFLFAYECFRRIILLNQEDVGTHFNLALIYLELSKIEDSLNEFEIAHSLDSNSLGVIFFKDAVSESLRKSNKKGVLDKIQNALDCYDYRVAFKNCSVFEWLWEDADFLALVR
jgi:tetratricopeptide (TPR) repeat protein